MLGCVASYFATHGIGHVPMCTWLHARPAPWGGETGASGRRPGSAFRPGAALGGVPIHPPLTIRPPTLCLPRSSVGVSGSHVVPHPSPAELTAEPKARAERIPSRRPEPSRAKLSERASRATAPFGTGRARRRPPLECRVQGAGYRASCTLHTGRAQEAAPRVQGTGCRAQGLLYPRRPPLETLPEVTPRIAAHARSQPESVALTAGDCRPHLRSAAGGRIAT